MAEAPGFAKTRLFLRQLKSVGFVDAGACEGADIILAKRREDDERRAGHVAELLEAKHRFDQLLREAEVDKAGRRMAGARLTKLREVVSQLTALLSEVDDESADSGGGKDTSMSKKFDPSTLPQEAQDHLAGVEKAANDRIAAAEKKAEEAAIKVADLEKRIAEKSAEPEDAFKGLPAEVRKRIEEAEKKAEEAEKAARDERDARLTQEFVQKAAFCDGKLAIKSADLGPILKRAYEGQVTKEDAAEIERVLKAAAETSKLTAVIGRDNGDDASAVQKIEAAAAEIRKADPKLTPAQARVEARRQNPDLAKAEKAERAAA